MSPRPRKVSDDAVFEAAYRVMQQVGPADLTLNAIADEAGVTAGALVQRFGSRQALLVALADRHAASSGDMLAALRNRYQSPLKTIRAYCDCMADLAASPAALARSLAYLYVDLTDPDLKTHLVAHARTTRAWLRTLVAEAVKAGELAPTTKPATLGRTIEAVISGSMMAWAISPDGPARAWMRQDLEAVLTPRLGRRPRRAGSRRSRS